MDTLIVVIAIGFGVVAFLLFQTCVAIEKVGNLLNDSSSSDSMHDSIAGALEPLEKIEQILMEEISRKTGKNILSFRHDILRAFRDLQNAIEHIERN